MPTSSTPSPRPRRAAARRLRLVAPVLLAPIVLAGCLRSEFEIDISDEGTADVRLDIAIDAAALNELSESFGGDPLPDPEGMSDDEIIATFFEGEDPCASEDSEVTFDSAPYVDDGWVGVRCSAEDVSLEEAFTVTDESEGEITQADGVTEIRLPLEGSGIEDIQDDPSAEMFSDLIDDIEITFRVSAPGGVADHNGTSVDGNTVIWEIDVTDPPTELRARWEPGAGGGGGSGTTVLIVVIVVAALAAIGAWLLISRRRRSPAVATAGAPAPPAPSSTVPPPPAAPTIPPPPPAAPTVHAPPPPPPPPPAS